MSQRQRRAKLSRRRWHSRAAHNVSAAAAATSAALAMSGLEAGAADAGRPLADGAAPVATQVAAVPAVAGVTTVISTPVVLHGDLFYGTAATGGGKLWEITGSDGEPKLIKQFRSRSTAAPAELTDVGGHLWFAADDELWKSGGTAASTVAVDTRVDPTAITDAAGTVFIETAGALWKSHGTQRQTTKLKTIKLGAKSEIVALGGRVYFTQPGSGSALWTSNGTPAGTRAVTRQPPSQYHNYSDVYVAGSFANVGGHLFFAGSESLPDEVTYDELWEASGTTAHSVVPYGIDPTNVGGNLYFFDFEKPNTCDGLAVSTGSGSCTPSTGYALWEGSKPLFDFDPTVDVSYGGEQIYPPYVGEPAVVGSSLFFAANLGGTTQLWRDQGGTEAGLADVGPLVPHNLTNVNGTLYFTGNEGTNPAQVYTSNGEAPAQNGTDAGTFAVTNFPASTTTPGDLTNLGGTLYFTANGGSATGYGLWELSTDSQ